MRFGLVVVCAIAWSGAACGGKAVFRLSSDENNAYALEEALARRRLPRSPTPVNSSGHPRVFALEAGTPKTIIGYDLALGTVLWKVAADVQSRISVGGDFIIALENNQLVARDQSRGAPRWRAKLQGSFVGAAADKDRAYLVTRDGDTWWLSALDGGSGDQLWRADASGELGAPAAHGGVVYVPFLHQWLSIVSGRTGEQLTRLRGVDEQISVLRVTSDVAYFGSKQGVFRVDNRSATGRRDEATYGQVKIPEQLERTSYGRDAYDPIQAAYTAADRSRVLWSSEAAEQGSMKLAGDGYAIHYFRYLLGFDLKGELRWAYSHPRVELVASEHNGHVILGISTTGDIVAIEPQTGAVRSRKSLGTTAPVLGATFDADGWSPSSEREPIETVPALVAIARDHDARFERVKELAVGALAKLPGAAVTRELLAVLSDRRAPQGLKDTVVDLLVQRKDPGGLAVLTERLSVHTDYLTRAEPDDLGPVAKAIAGLDGTPVDPKLAMETLTALQAHLDAPTTVSSDLIDVIGAMVAIGNGAERPALASHLLLYHADDELGADIAWQKAIVVALDARGGAGERELLRQVAADPRTKPGLVSIIREALGAD